MMSGQTAIAGLVAAVTFSAACSFGSDGSEAVASPTPLATPTMTPTAAPTEVVATPRADAVFINARPIEVLAGRAELPSDLALIIASGGELLRIHRPASGELEMRLLFDPFAHSGTQLITYWNIHHLGPSLPPGQLAIAVCTTGECPGHGAGSEDALVTIFRSIDGGVSWGASPELDGVALIAAGTDLEQFALQRLARAGDARSGRFEWWPDARAINPPDGREHDREPIILGDRSLVWWTADGRLVDTLGLTLLDLGDELSGGSLGRGIAVLSNADGTRLAVTWIEMLPNDDSAEAWRWSIYDLVGRRYEASDIFAAPAPMIPTAWLSDSTLLFNADLSSEQLGEESVTAGAPRLPVIFDILAGSAQAIDVPGGTLGGGWAVAVQQGPFAEIKAGVGDCLNLRTSPSLEGGVLRCVAHATLLEALTPIDSNWVLVRASDGVEGWVSGAFVRQAVDPAPTATATATPSASQ